jgi:type IV pilus assembly protein PilC
MTRFYYTARSKSGEKITNSEEANNEDELLIRLQAKDLIVSSIEPEKTETIPQKKGETVKKSDFKAKHNRITSDDLVLFCRQLATLLGAGVTILKSLDIISKQVSSRKLHNVTLELKKNMEEGLSLHEAMSKHLDVFSELWVNLAESGVASGNLAIVLSRLAAYLERNAEFKKKIISALIYPSILMGVGLIALLFLTIKIIPTFAEIFASFNITLPLITRILIFSSNVLRKYFLVFLGLGIVGLFLFKGYAKTKAGRRKIESFKLGLPVFGEFFRGLTIERFSSEMSTLIESGVPILYSLDITEHSVDNLIMADIIRQIKDDVRQGKPLSKPLERSGFFDPMVVQMVSIGEEIGELPQMFKRINTFYQSYVETFLTRFIALFEPLVLVFMGLVIGIMVIGMFLPIFQLTQVGGGG